MRGCGILPQKDGGRTHQSAPTANSLSATGLRPVPLKLGLEAPTTWLTIPAKPICLGRCASGMLDPYDRDHLHLRAF
jgi:hypothetical protein